MGAKGIYRAFNRTPLASTFRGKLYAAIAIGALPGPLAVGIWLLAGGGAHGWGLLVVLLIAVLTGALISAALIHVLMAPVDQAGELAEAAVRGRALPEVSAAESPRDPADRLLADVARLAAAGTVAGGASMTDPLTGLRNRLWCETRLSEFLGGRSDSRAEFVLALVSLDQLRGINQKHGHAAGDACLLRLADVTRRVLRTGDWLARWSGNEFAAVLRGGRSEAQPALERLREYVSASSVEQNDGDDLRISVSIGAVAATGGEAVDALFRAADSAVMSARSAGRDRVVFFGD